MLQKEKNKERRERISYVLIQRLAAKFGNRYLGLIGFFVEEFFSTHDEITSNDVDVLEREIRNAIRANMEAHEHAKALANASKPQSNQESDHLSSKPQSGQWSRPPSGKEWALIQAYQVIQDEEKDRMEKEKARETKMKFRASLDQHMTESKQLHQADNKDDQNYVKHIMNDIEKFHEEEHQKVIAKKKHHHDELIMRKAQIEEQKKRILDEKEELRQIELRNLELAREQIRLDNEKREQLRLKAKEENDRIKKENELNKKIRMEEKIREAELDHHLMVEYAAKLDRENAAREEAFNQRMKEMEKYGAKFENEGAGKALRDEQIRFEQMLLKEQQKKEEEDRRKEREKEENRKRQLLAQLEENRRQLEQRRLEYQQERERDAVFAEKFKQEMDEWKRQEIEKHRKKLLSQADYRTKLDSQIEELKKVDRNLTGITSTEKNLNMKTLKEISDDPKVLSKVMHQMRISQAYKNKK